MVDESKPEVLTTQEVAERLAVHPATVTRWARSGVIRSIRVGRTLRFRRDDIDELLSTPAAS